MDTGGLFASAAGLAAGWGVTWHLWSMVIPWINAWIRAFADIIFDVFIRTMRIRSRAISDSQKILINRYLITCGLSESRGQMHKYNLAEAGWCIDWSIPAYITLKTSTVKLSEIHEIKLYTLRIFGDVFNPWFERVTAKSNSKISISQAANNGVDIAAIATQNIVPRSFANTPCEQSVVERLRYLFKAYMNPSAAEVRLGVPNTLTVLLYGPPGTGKSTLIRAMACEFKHLILNCNLATLKTELMSRMVSSMKRNTIFLFEDIDAQFETVERNKDPEKGVNMSTFLNFLNGSITAKRQFVIITTNYPERLDSRIMRSERVNAAIEIRTTEETIAQMYNIYFDEACPVWIAKEAIARKMTTADFQSMLRRCKVADAVACEMKQKSE